MATRAAQMPPMAYPLNMNALVMFLLFGSAYSMVRAMAVGMTPPRPKPVRKRSRPKISGLGANAVSTMPTENQRTQPMMMRRRPTRSVMVPMSSAPSSMPISA